MVIELAEEPKTEEQEKLNKNALVIYEKANALEVVDQVSNDRAVALGRVIVTEIGARVEFFKGMKDAAWKAHREVVKKEKDSISPLENARNILSTRCGEWRDEQDRLAKEEQDRIAEEERKREEDRQRKEADEKAERDRKLKEAEDAEAERLRKIKAAEDAEIERQRKLKDAEAAKESGDDDKAEQLIEEAGDDKNASEQLREEAQEHGEVADALIDEAAESEAREPEPEPEPVQPTVAAPAKTKGSGTTKKYFAVVTDEIALIKGVVAGIVPKQAIKIDESFLNKMASALKGDLDYPGVDVESESKTSFRKKT